MQQTKPRLFTAGGEAAYSRTVGAEARHWIAAHPVEAARLTLRHYRQFYVPDTWQERATNWEGADRFRIVCLQLVGILGLIGLLVGVRRRHPHYRMLALYVAVVGLPYALVQPIPRYGYLVYPLLVLLATRVVVEGIAAIPMRRRPTMPKPLPV